MDAPAPVGTLAALRAALDIVAVAERLGLEPVRTGGGGAKILCPSHAEDSPSCLLYADGHLHCFGCGFHGSALDLVSTVRGVGFGDAIEWAATAFGLPLPARDPAAAARTAALRAVRDRLATGLADRPSIPAGLTPEAAEAIGLGWADESLIELVAQQSPAVAPLAPAEARAWSGRPTLELASRGGVIGVAVLFESSAGAMLVRPRRLEGASVAGLAAARPASAEIGAVYHAADPGLFLAARAAGVRAIVSSGRPLDTSTAGLLSSLAPRIVIVRRPGAGLAIEEAAAVLATGSRVGFAAIGDDGVPTTAVRLAEALVFGLAALPPAEARAIVSEILAAAPSRSSRALYAAALAARGVSL